MSRRVVLVTGGTQGIGNAFVHSVLRCSLRRASEDEEAVVIFTGSCRETVDAAMGNLYSAGYSGQSFEGVVCDASDHRRSSSLIQSVVKQYDRLDTLLLNAGDLEFCDMANATPEVVERHDKIPNAAIELVRSALPHLKASKGSLGFVSSILALHGEVQLPLYVAAKCKVEGFLRSVEPAFFPEARVRIFHVGATLTRAPQRAFIKLGLSAADADTAAAAFYDRVKTKNKTGEVALAEQVAETMRHHLMDDTFRIMGIGPHDLSNGFQGL